eukprot:5821099-Amphidinium_carterae.1
MKVRQWKAQSQSSAQDSAWEYNQVLRSTVPSAHQRAAVRYVFQLCSRAQWIDVGIQHNLYL